MTRGFGSVSGRLSLLLAAAVATLLVAACSRIGPAQGGNGSAVPSSRPAPKQVASTEFVGASVTAGWYSSGVSDAYPADVVAALRLRGEKLDHRVRAVPGATVRDAFTWDIHQRANIVDNIVPVLQQGGYQLALTDPKIASTNVFGSQPYQVPRIRVAPDEPLSQFANEIAR